MVKQVMIWTDGACIGNPGPGGYGAVILRGEDRQELSGGYRLTTNNRMEMLAAIVALESLSAPTVVTLYSDSLYLVNSINKGWAAKWRANGWMRTKKDKAINPDLWGRLLELCEIHRVEFKWVKGHAGNVENERCDALAVEAAAQVDLQVDVAYERNQNEGQQKQQPLLF